jgi:hypothetical protein
MARKTLQVVIDAEGRDKGKVFLITEMPPRQAEKWATRALLALGRGGNVDMPADFREDLEDMGMVGIAALGVRALTSIPFDDAEPLLDEMMACVSVIPDVKIVDQTSREPIARALIDSDIEEVGTLFRLRSEALELHTGFSVAAFLSRLGAATKERLISSVTRTSPEPLPGLSEAG